MSIITQGKTKKHAVSDTNFHTAGSWKVFASNGSGEVVEIANAVDGYVLTATGASTLPAWEVAAGAGDANLDGGFANATYLPSQNVDGGSA